MSRYLRLGEPVGVDEVVGRVTLQDPAPFIDVGQTGNPPRFPFFAALRPCEMAFGIPRNS